ncbi:hypothetical protein VI817_002602 [Penicillium citrinum]|nr:hypothetical protein VI817_002602 [Penicillium citrinum]
MFTACGFPCVHLVVLQGVSKVGHEKAFLILVGTPQDRKLSYAVLEFNWGAGAVIRHSGEAPDLVRAPNIWTVKGIVQECVYEGILDNTELQVVISFCVSIRRARAG